MPQPEFALDGSNPDLRLLRDVNGLARETPPWFDHAMVLVGEYGLVLLVAVLAGWCWWRAARRSDDAPAAVAGVLWSALAAVTALALNVPIRGIVARPRPFVDHEGLDVLVRSRTDYSFVSDHATLTMAVAVGVFLVSRRIGLVGILIALAEGFCQVYLGVHYPTDVIGGYALGTAVALLLAPLAMALLTPLASAVARSRAGWLIRSPRPRVRVRSGEPFPEHLADDTDLAA